MGDISQLFLHPQVKDVRRFFVGLWKYQAINTHPPFFPHKLRNLFMKKSELIDAIAQHAI
jgi:hypothetical protein